MYITITIALKELLPILRGLLDKKKEISCFKVCLGVFMLLTVHCLLQTDINVVQSSAQSFRKERNTKKHKKLLKNWLLLDC